MPLSSSSEGRSASEFTPLASSTVRPHRSAKDDELLVRLGEFDGDLRCRHRVCGKGEAGRPLQQIRDTLGVGAFERKLDEPVLRHLDLSASASHLAAQFGHGADGQARIVSDDDHAGLGEDVMKRRHDFALLCSFQCSLRLFGPEAKPSGRKPRHVARRARGPGNRPPRSFERRSGACPPARKVAQEPTTRFKPISRLRR